MTSNYMRPTSGAPRLWRLLCGLFATGQIARCSAMGAIKKLCSYPGCMALVDYGRCPKHKRKETYDERRGTPRERGYDGAWKRFRAAYLRNNPLCAKCRMNGKLTPATVVDHMTPMSQGGEKYDLDNLQPLCAACHNSKSAKERKK